MELSGVTGFNPIRSPIDTRPVLQRRFWGLTVALANFVEI